MKTLGPWFMFKSWVSHIFYSVRNPIWRFFDRIRFGHEERLQWQMWLNNMSDARYEEQEKAKKLQRRVWDLEDELRDIWEKKI